jgi:hypothetical protein
MSWMILRIMRERIILNVPRGSGLRTKGYVPARGVSERCARRMPGTAGYARTLPNACGAKKTKAG